MFRFIRVLAFVLTVACSIHTQRAEAASFIRIIENGGTWWFEDAHGQRFFSLGVNCIGGCFGHSEDSPMEASRKQWIISHLKDQGFNTAASWSSPSVWDHFYVADQIYTGFREDRDDVFDDSLWDKSLEPCIREEVKPFLGKENFIGYFIDNEPKWNAAEVFGLYLGLSRQSSGSKAFISFLKQFYEGSIERLNNEWGVSYKGFEEIPGSSPTRDYSPIMESGILRAWRNEVARAYYERYVSLLRLLDPNHLILGIRYRSIPDVDLFKTLSPYFDINSVNDYNRYGNLRPEFEALYRASGKPLMITEFSFSGFPNPGHRSELFVDVYSQENRGIGYRKYVLEAARAPFIVGMHWFFWMDYPSQEEAQGGFLPDENVGLVSNDESRTYEELSEWIRKTNREVSVIHRIANAIVQPEPVLAKEILKQFTPKLDGDTTEWPNELAMRPSVVTCLRDVAIVDQTYFISHDGDALYVAAQVSDSHLENPGGEWFWTGDFLFLHLSLEEPQNINASGDLSLFICPVGSGPSKTEPFAVRWCSPEKSKVIPAVIVKHTTDTGFVIEAKIPWASLEKFDPRHSCPWKVRLGYQNANEICQGHWNGIVIFQTP